MRLLMIHGRAQGGKDPGELKQTWIETLETGLAAAGEQLPAGVKFDFPFYGDALDAFTEQASLPTPDDVVAKGTGQNREFELFLQTALDEIYRGSSLTEAQVTAEMTTGETREKGPQNWGWVQAIARALDKNFNGVSDWTIEKFLKDVFLYVNTPVVTKGINDIVESMIVDDEPTVVIGHSLGTVVGYRVLLANQGRLNAVKYITLGSPLGIRAISLRLGIPENTAREGWYNAYDDRDVVALNPLDDTYFPTDPEIVNNDAVKNSTKNRHGIAGYLDDADVARAIAQAARLG